MKLTKNLISLLISLIPFGYLAWVYNSLPAKVPMHWNYKMEVDRYGSKNELIYLAGMGLIFYIILIIVPLIDPKNKIKAMGAKYESFKFIFVLFMSLLSIFIIYNAQETNLNSNFLFILIAFLYIIIGNYAKTFKPNYFIGIRTPWTLENAEIWKKTHLLGGRYFFIGGLAILILTFIVSKRLMGLLFVIITLIISIVPAIYSYVLYRKMKKESE